MTLDDLKRAVFLATPAGMTTEKQLVYSFEALAASAGMQGIELTSKRETFKALRDLGFVDVKRRGERMLAVYLVTYAAIMIPVIKEMTEEIKASR
ncbi:hypothetical protein R69619_03328 [Paraburkholderia nemoris]|uniref:hypothetical protein n=1 Tax=Paraburkholderia nemoris TaxID=2793076 RepID=UPI001909AAEF|nr:hypothetical protein [Paraburkholderia nemoris]MBK3743346.1 hypothetical protein [Paraburkholderia aspalathi]CAE6759984.1 hypothetical protein R69619_03328 [Paraburkholderia nemoris]